MKRLILLVAVLFAAGMLFQGHVYAKEYKIAYVDLAKVFDDYSKTKELDKSFEAKGKVKEVERKKLFDELKKMRDEQALLSDKAKAEKQPAIDDKTRAIQDFDRKTRDEFVKERNDSVGSILKDIEKIVTDYSKQEGYDIILNSRMLLYGREDMDLTGEILKRLNK